MKLTDIVVLEAAPLGDDPVDLKDVVKYFPSQHKKAIKAFARTGRLTFGGQKVFDEGGQNGDALDEAIQMAKRFLEHEPVEVSVMFDTEGTDLEMDRDMSHWEFDGKIHEAQPVWVGYNTKTDDLVLGFDVWLDEEVFNQEWDNKWDDAFDESFDMDNEEHEKVFNRAWKKYSQNQFFGAIVEVNSNMHASMNTEIMDGGFYRGPYKVMKKDAILELTF